MASAPDPRSGRRAANSPKVEITSLTEIDRFLPEHQVPSSAYGATWPSVPIVPDMRAGEVRRVLVQITNDGSVTWPFGSQGLPMFRLGYRWRSGETSNVVTEGRATFTADVAPGATVLAPVMVQSPESPGEYMLEFGMVHEGVRWFGEGPSLSILIQGR